MLVVLYDVISSAADFLFLSGFHSDGIEQPGSAGEDLLPGGRHLHCAQLCPGPVHLRPVSRTLRSVLVLVVLLVLLLLAVSQAGQEPRIFRGLPAGQR